MPSDWRKAGKDKELWYQEQVGKRFIRNSLDFITHNVKGCKVQIIEMDDETYGSGEQVECVPYPDGSVGSRCPDVKPVVKPPAGVEVEVKDSNSGTKRRDDMKKRMIRIARKEKHAKRGS